jgi:hypothetical protein
VRPAAAAAPLVTGRVLETVARVPARPDAEGRPDVRWLVLGLAAAACLLAGWVREGATRDVRPQRR